MFARRRLRLRPYDSELDDGLTNHAPMVVEALCALGRPDAVTSWLYVYLTRARPAIAARAPLRPDEWPMALGRPEREADLRALLAGEIRDRGWRVTLATWTARLAA